MTAEFSHRDTGTPESEWHGAFDERMPGLPELGPDFFRTLDHLIVVAAHPDDETLGAAGLLARAGASGVRASVIVATSGEGSHPGADLDAGALARRREDETRAALAEVDAGATIHFLRLPDGRLAEHRFSLAQAISDAVSPPVRQTADGTRGRHRAEALEDPFGSFRADGDRSGGDPAGGGSALNGGKSGGTVLVAPWAGDRHPDHAAAADAARDVALGAGIPVLGYPIWLWHWAAPGDPEVPWGEMRVLALDDAQRDAKARAIAAHASQVRLLGEAPDAEPLLHAGMLAHFARPFELFVAPAAPAVLDAPVAFAVGVAPAVPVAPDPDSTRGRTDVAPGELHDDGVAAEYFDRLHASADDPWGFETRWYEERKRAVLLASLPDRSYGHVLEVGSSTGVLSRALAARASGRLVGVDVSEVAVERARERNADLPIASFERMPVPAEWPSGAFDLVVVSEIGYYLDPPDLTGLIERILGSLTPQGAVVLCHWRHPVAGRAIDGDTVHEVFADRQEFTRLARHLEEDFVLDVLVRAPGESVARREGIV